MPTHDALVRLTNVARALGVSIQTAKRRVGDAGIDVRRIGGRNDWWISTTDAGKLTA